VRIYIGSMLLLIISSQYSNLGKRVIKIPTVKEYERLESENSLHI
jgi:hypothetical protein